MAARLVRFGTVALLVSGLLVAATTRPAPARADAGSSSPSVADASTAPDEATALQIASTYGHIVAVTSETSETAQVTANPDGSFSLSSSPIPVRAQGPDGSWLPLDLGLQPDGPQLAPETAAVPVKFSAGGSATPLAQVQAASGDWLTETWAGGALPTPSVSGDSATYAEVMPGVDLQVTATAVGMSEVLVVKDAQAAQNPELRDVAFGIDDGAMSSTVNSDGSLTTSSNGTPQLVSDAPTWWDSSSPGASAAGPGGNGVPMPVTHTDTPSSITVNAASVATMPDVTYPVYVDPPSSFQGDRVSYTFIDSAYPTTSYWNGAGASDAYAHVGHIDSGDSDDGKAHTTRTFWSIDTSALAGRVIVSAAFDATEVYSSSCTATNVELWTTSAATPSLTWSDSPQQMGWGDHIATTAMAHGYSSSCPSSAVGWDVTAAVQRSADQSAATINLALRASDEADWQSWKKFRNDPYLDVRFYTPPTQPAYRSVSGCHIGCTQQPSFTHLSEPRLSARASTDAGNTLYYKFEIYSGWSASPGASALVTTGTAGDTALGTTASWGDGVPLADGGQYEYRALACIGGTQVCGTQWSGWWTFQVDLTAPNPPTLTPVNSDFEFYAGPQNPPPATRTGQQGVPGDVVIGANGSTDVAQYVYVPESSLSVTTDTAPDCNITTGDVYSVCNLDPNGNATVSITPQEFTSTITLVAIDKAGNVSIGDAQGNSTNSDTYTYFPQGTTAGQALHAWVEQTTGSGLSVADSSGTAPGLALTLTSNNWGSAGPYPSKTYDGYLTFSSASHDTGTTVATTDVPADAAHSLTAAIWVKPNVRATNDVGYQTVLSQDGAADSGFYIQRTPDEHWRVCMPQAQTDTAAIDCVTGTAVNTGAWTLLTMVWDAPQRLLTLYTNLTLTGGVHMSHTVTGDAATGDIVVGRALYHHSQTDWYNGALADPLLYPVVLNTSEINILHGSLPSPIGDPR